MQICVGQIKQHNLCWIGSHLCDNHEFYVLSISHSNHGKRCVGSTSNLHLLYEFPTT
jgi:hypothetical protein